MNTLDFFHIHARYNRWMNRKIYDAAAEFPDAERKRDLGAFFKSIHGTLNHLVLTDRIWLGRFTGDTERFRSLDSSGKPIDIHSLGQVLYEDFAELRHERERTDSDIGKFVDSLSQDVLETPLHYKTSSGEPCSHPLWWALMHMFNHGTHHRGQTTTLLKQLGKDPGVTDLVAMLRNNEG
ncbi:MAG: damage-inducible protein DinB [Deltaproteobacteria bacterium]|nr:damage-inducible protein DinB [Deltaproteobacteria bacterium]